MSRPDTPSFLRTKSFEKQGDLQAPLNYLLRTIQERISNLETEAGIVLLGPRRVVLPVDAATTPGSEVAFSMPSDFTPAAVFLVNLTPADVGALDVSIAPAAISYEVTAGAVIVKRIVTTTTTGVALNLTLGAIRG